MTTSATEALQRIQSLREQLLQTLVLQGADSAAAIAYVTQRVRFSILEDGKALAAEGEHSTADNQAELESFARAARAKHPSTLAGALQSSEPPPSKQE